MTPLDSHDEIDVLHVEDDADLRDLVSTWLSREHESIQTTGAETVAEGRRLLDADDTAFDCVVSDYNLPESDGIEFLREVRDARPDLPFILFTARGSEDVAAEAVSAGVTDYLRKELGTAQYSLLANRIVNAVAAHRAERQRSRQARITGVIREVMADLVRAETEEAIERAVCERITGSEPYRFAWIGGADGDGVVRARVSAGDAGDYLDEVEIRADDSKYGTGPAGRALSTGERQVAQHIRSDESFSPWEDVADSYGYESVAVLPLRYDADDYGLLAIYADRPYAFDDSELEVLSELADTTGHALHAAETRRTLERRESTLRETNAVLEALLDGLPMGVLAEGGDGRVIAVNQPFLDLFGVETDSDALVGTERTAVGERVCSSFADGSACHERRDGPPGIDEDTVTLVDGRSVERWCLSVDLAGDPGRLWVYDDVTERLERERRLAESESRYRTLAENVPNGGVALFERDDAGVLRYTLVGGRIFDQVDLDPEAMEGAALEAVHSDPYVETYVPLYEAALDGERNTFRFQYDGRTYDGYALPVVDGGSIVCGLAMTQDVTSEARRAAELERQNDRLERFASILSHDLRNPLSVAQGHLELAREGREASLDDVGNALSRMESLVEDLLTIAHGGEADTAVVSIVEVSRRAWDSVETGEATLDLRCSGEVVAAPGRLQQLFENLFRNSVEHGSRGSPSPSVTVVVDDLSNGFVAADDGPGIPPERRETVFESGYSTGEGGTGLGLTIVRTVAAEHGWDVSLSESESGGARFAFTGVDRPE